MITKLGSMSESLRNTIIGKDMKTSGNKEFNELLDPTDKSPIKATIGKENSIISTILGGQTSLHY